MEKSDQPNPPNSSKATSNLTTSIRAPVLTFSECHLVFWSLPSRRPDRISLRDARYGARASILGYENTRRKDGHRYASRYGVTMELRIQRHWQMRAARACPHSFRVLQHVPLSCSEARDSLHPHAFAVKGSLPIQVSLVALPT